MWIKVLNPHREVVFVGSHPKVWVRIVKKAYIQSYPQCLQLQYKNKTSEINDI